MAYSGPEPLQIIAGGTAQKTSPSFCAYLNAPVTNVTGDGTNYSIPFNAKFYDTTSSYNIGTGLFTVPVTGNYLFTGSLFLEGVTTAHTVGIVTLVDNSSNNYFIVSTNPANVMNPSNDLIVNGSCSIALTAGATIKLTIMVSNGALVVTLNGASTANLVSYFSGYLLK